MIYKWDEITGREFQLLKPEIALLPVGTIERHGDHLPLGTDNIVPSWIADKVAERLGGDVIVLPQINYGVTVTLANFPGSINIPSEVFMQYVKHVLLEVARNGVKYVVVLNGHGGNTRELQIVAKEVTSLTNLSVLIIDWWRDVAQQKRTELFKYPGHAGEDETSAVMAIRPELVRKEYAKDHVMPYPTLKIYSRKLDESIFPEAVNGKATLASIEKGKEFMEAVVNEVIKVVKEFLSKA